MRAKDKWFLFDYNIFKLVLIFPIQRIIGVRYFFYYQSRSLLCQCQFICYSFNEFIPAFKKYVFPCHKKLPVVFLGNPISIFHFPA